MNLRDLIYSESQTLSQIEKIESHHERNVSFSQDISQINQLNNSLSQSFSHGDDPNDRTGCENIR